MRPIDEPVDPRVQALFDARYHALTVRSDRLMMMLMLGQWVAAIGFAIWLSPLAWVGKQSAIHGHVFAAIFVGGAITSLPVLMVLRQPGAQSTRYVTASAQVLWSALLIHLTGGRIETHFHVFASLAILAFYRDWKLLIPGTVLVAGDHFVRGLLWPESVYGVTNPEWWRFLEHAGWVAFIDAFLVFNCMQSRRELWKHCEQQLELEDAKDAAARLERLAAVGQLAASVGHELRNPLAAIRNAHTLIRRRLSDQGGLDPRVAGFFEIVSREIEASNHIIANLLDFSRPKDPVRVLCPLRPLVEEALQIVPQRSNVTLVDDVGADLPVPELDRDQFRQLLVNLVQNASEAIPAERSGRVAVGARVAAGGGWIITVQDDGCGIPRERLEKVFQPLFSTKTRGTGLGLGVVQTAVARHGGTLSVESTEGVGTTFTIALPACARTDAA